MIPRHSSTPLTFGKNGYQLISLNSETGHPVLRGSLSRERENALLSNPKGDSDYIAKCILLDTALQTEDNMMDLALLKEKIEQLNIAEEDHHVVPIDNSSGISYAMINLDEFGVLLAACQQYPDDYFWIALTDENQHPFGHMVFHDQQINIFSDCSINVFGQENNIQSLFINTHKDVVIHRPLRVIKNINIFCHTLTCHAEQPDAILLQAGDVNVLCLAQCIISPETQVVSRDGHCKIKAGAFIHKGHIESEQDAHVIAESAEIYGTLIAKGKKGVSIISLGLQTHGENKEKKQMASHIHGSIITVIVGASQAHLNGLISTKRLAICAPELKLFGKIYVQGDVLLYTYPGNITLEKNAKIIFNGKLFRQLSQLAAWIEGSLLETPDLEIYFKKIIDPHLVLTEEEQLRSTLPKALLHSTETSQPTTPGGIEFLPVLPKKDKYLYQLYDKTQFASFDLEYPSSEEKTKSQVIFSAEQLTISGQLSLSSAYLLFQASNLNFSGQVDNISFFGSVDALLRSETSDLRGAVIDTQRRGKVTVEADDLKIESHISAEQIVLQSETLSFSSSNTNNKNKIETTLSAANRMTIESKKNSTIAKDCKLTLESPDTVAWLCKNFYLEGELDFEQLSIKAERLVSVLVAEMHGRKLDIDSRYFVSGLSKFHINNFSVESVVTILGLCHIASDFYCNTSIVNLSCALYTPKTLSLNVKSGLAFSLAAANTLISILQLALHEPTSQLALTVARLGINAGPALYQAYQLTKNIQKVTQAEHISQGELIKVANQTKNLLLSLGSLAYGGDSVVNQFVDFAQKQHMPVAAHHWDNALRAINDLNNVVTPLMSTVLPGNVTNSFFDVNVDINMNLAKTSYSLANIHAGIDSSVMTSHTSIVDITPNPVSLNVSPTSTNTNVCSIDIAHNASIVPGISHNERCYGVKIEVGTGMSSLPQYQTLTTDKLIMTNHASEQFEKSTIQANDVIMEENTQLTMRDSTLNVTHQIDNAGKEQFDHSRVTASEFENKKGASIELEKSQLQGATLNNDGFTKNVESTMTVDQVQNHHGATEIALNASLNFKILMDDQGNISHTISSHLNTSQWEEKGLFAADKSDIEGDKVRFIQEEAKIGSLTPEKQTQIGFRTTDLHVKDFKSDVDFSLDLKGTQFHKNVVPTEFNYVDDSKLSVSLQSGGIQYHSNDPIDITGNFVSAISLGVDAQKITASGEIKTTTSMTLTANQIKFNHADTAIQGTLNVTGGTVLFDNSHTQAGENIQVLSEKVSIKNGSEFTARGDIDVEANKLNSVGGKTVTTHQEEHTNFFVFKSTKTEVETEFQPNVFASEKGHIDFKIHGLAKLVDTTLITEDGDISISAKNNLNILPNIGQDSVTQQNSIVGVTTGHGFDAKEVASNCHFQSGKNILVQSEEGDIHNVSAGMTAKGQIIIDVSPGHQMTNEGLILNETQSGSHLKFNLSVAGLSLDHTKLSDHLPLKNAIDQVHHAKGPMDTLAADTELATETVNLTDDLLKAAKKKELSGEALKQLQLGDQQGFNPTLHFGLVKTEFEMHRQVLMPGSMTAAEIIVHADGATATFEKGYEVHAAQGTIYAKTLTSSDAPLTSSVKASTTQLGLSTNLTNVIGADISHAEQSTNTVNHIASDNLTFDNLNLYAHEVNLNGTQITVNKSLTGHIDQLNSQSSVDKNDNSSYAVGVSTGGDIFLKTHSSHSETITVSNPIIANNSKDFTVAELNLTGQTASGINANHIQTQPLHEVKQENDFSFNASYRDLLPNDHPANNVLSLVHVHSSDQNIVIEHGKNGEKVLENSTKNLNANIPLYHSTEGEQFINNIHGLISPESSQEQSQQKIIPKDQPVVKHPSPQPKSSHPVSTATSVTVTNQPVILTDLNQETQEEKNILFGPPAFGVEEDKPESDGPDETSREPCGFLSYSNVSSLVETAGHRVHEFNALNDLFQDFVKSSTVETYLSQIEETLGSQAALKDFIRRVMDPFAGTLSDLNSYFYLLYAQLDGMQFVSSEVYEQPNIFKMVDKIAENVDRTADYYTQWLNVVRGLYFPLIAAEDAYLYFKYKVPIQYLIGDDIYRTIGGIGGASLSMPLIPMFTDALNSSAHFFADVLGKESLWLIQPINLFCKFSIPLIGTIIGGSISAYLFEEEKDHNTDIALSLGIAKEASQAGYLQRTFGDKFKESVFPDYSAKMLSNNSIASYYNYVHLLQDASTPMGRALIRPIPEDVFKLSQLADPFSRQTNLPAQFGEPVTDENLMRYAKFLEDSEFKSIENVDGDFFRTLIEDHSAFSDASRLINIGKVFFVTSLLESFYDLATTDNIPNTVMDITLSYASAELGGFLGALGGTAFCGAFSPLCVAAASLAGGGAAVALTQNALDQMRSNPDLMSGLTRNELQSLPSLNSVISFFKPSERLYRDQDNRQSPRLSKFTPDRDI